MVPDIASTLRHEGKTARKNCVTKRKLSAFLSHYIFQIKVFSLSGRLRTQRVNLTHNIFTSVPM